MYYVYVLKSLEGKKTYVGSTSKDVFERLGEHNAGRVRWTSGHRPFKLLFFESFETNTEARRRELFLKTGNGRRVLASKIGTQITVLSR